MDLCSGQRLCGVWCSLRLLHISTHASGIQQELCFCDTPFYYSKTPWRHEDATGHNMFLDYLAMTNNAHAVESNATDVITMSYVPIKVAVSHGPPTGFSVVLHPNAHLSFWPNEDLITKETIVAIWHKKLLLNKHLRRLVCVSAQQCVCNTSRYTERVIVTPVNLGSSNCTNFSGFQFLYKITKIHSKHCLESSYLDIS